MTSRHQPSLTRRQRLFFLLAALAILLPMFYLVNKYASTTKATWFDDNFAYRKKITIGNTGSADSDKKVKLDINTATAVDPNTANFNTTDQTFTPLMAKRNSAGPFAAGVIVQSKPDDGTSVPDVLSFPQGTQINGNFNANFDTTQGSVALWWTPEFAYNDSNLTGLHYLWYISANYYLAYDYTNDRYQLMIGTQTMTVSSSIAAGTTYGLVARWDTQNVIQGANYADLSIDDTQSFGITVQPTVSAPAATLYIGSNGTAGGINGLIEGATVYRRVLYDGTNGINTGNGDEVSKIKTTGGTDPTLTTGSWDVVFALPTNASAGSIATGTGNAWTHPHLSNLLYTSTTNTGGFMMNGTYTTDGWADEGTPTAVAALATGEKIYPGGYKTTSDAVNEGIYYDKTVTAGNDWVVRAVAHSDGTSVPKIILYDQTNGAEIGSLTGTTGSTRAAPDTFVFTGEAPAGMTTLRVKLINTAASGVTYWHQVEVLSNLVTNPSLATGSGDPWIPTGWTNSGLSAGTGTQESTIVHSGTSGIKITSGQTAQGIAQSINTTDNSFFSRGAWIYRTAGSFMLRGQLTDRQQASNATFPSVSVNTTNSWQQLYLTIRDTGGNNSPELLTSVVESHTGYFDDAYNIALTDVSLTVTPASQTNSTETSGLRVDGKDTSTMPTTNLTATTGTIKFRYTPRHSAADVAKFGSATPVIVQVMYNSDTNNRITLYWGSANTLNLYYNMGGVSADVSWNATGAIVAGTTYTMQINYTGGSTMVLSVDGTARITHSSIPAAFTGALDTAYWGNQSSALQGDATFAATTVSTGTKMQTDCDDIRFTDINGLALKYYFDSTNGPCNIASSDFYVLMPTINTGDTIIYMYYGNPSAISGSQSAQFSQGTFAPTSGPTLSSEELAPAPAAYWKFDDGQGSTAQDSTVNNNDGTISGATWTEESRCVSGKCLQFDGTNDVVTVSNTVAGIQSVSFWVRPTTTSEQYIDLNGSAYIQTSSGTISATGFTSPTIYVNGVVSSTIVANQWQYISVTTGTAISGSAIKIAQVSTNYGQVFMDEVKIYPYARTAAQVAADFAKGSSSKGGGVLGAQQSVALSEGLVGYWKMDESSWNGTPNEVVDASGNSAHGTAAGSATTASGKFGNGGSLNGTTGYTTHGNFTTLNGSSQATFSYWYNAGTISETDTAISLWPGTANKQFLIYHLSGQIMRVFVPASGSDVGTFGSSASSVLPTSGWNFVTVVYDGTQSGNSNRLKFYINSTPYSFTSFSGTIPATLTSSITPSLCIGAVSCGSNFYAGTLDETRIYNRALSGSEVSQLYNFAPGPVGYWKMDEATGTSANDASGNGNTGTLTLGPTWTNGKFGAGVKFDGTNDYVNITRNAGLEPNNVSISMWVKLNTISATQTLLGKRQDAGGHFSYGFYQLTGTNTINFFYGNGGTDTSASYTYSPGLVGSWVHVEGSYDGTTGRIYVNGVKGTDGTAITGNLAYSSSYDLIIGGFSVGSLPVNATIDDVRIYNYARTQKQIVEDMNAGHPAGGSPVGSSVATFHMDDMEGTVAEDSSINGNDLTLSSRSWTASGKVNGAWNGTNAVWLSRADDSDFDVSATEDYSITGWVKSDSATNPGATEYVVNKASATVAGYAVYFNTSGFLCFGIDDDTTWGPDIASCSTTDFYDATWHHFSAVRDTVADKTYIYVDGISRDSDTDTTSATLANSLLLYVGDRDGTDNGDEFAGDIDEINIYRFALNADDVKIVMNNNSSVAISVLGATEASTLTDGTGTAPVAEWLMNEGRDNTCTGGTNDVCDVSGNGNDGANSGPVWTAGKNGGGLKFDGVDDYVDVGNNDVFNMRTHDLSFSLWFKTTTTSTGQLLTKRSTTTSGNARFDGYSAAVLADGTVNSCFRYTASSDTDTCVTSASVFNDGQWHHMLSTFTRTSNLQMFIDGKSQGTANISYASAIDLTFLQPLNIARRLASSGAGSTNDIYFNGLIDEVRIYNYARTQAQVAYDYNRGRPVAHWRLDECQGSTAYGSPLGAAHDSALNGTITIGASGTQTAVGNCTSGNSAHAWYNGATGKFNSSLNFDGTDDYVSVASSTSLKPAQLTQCLWAKANSYSALAVLSGKKALSSGYASYALVFRTGPSRITFTISSATPTEYHATSTNMATGVWQHWCGTYDGTTQKLYLNGALQDTQTPSITITHTDTYPLTIGSFDPSSGFYFSGQIDDVKVFNYSLSAEQVRNVMNGSAAVRYGPATGSP